MRYLALLLLAAGLPGYQATFRSNTRLVQMNVVVRDHDRPVDNLRKDDFVLSDEGKPREISVFTVVSARQAGGSARPLPANTYTNRGGRPASITIILLDRLNTLAGAGTEVYEERSPFAEELALANARKRLLTFLDRYDGTGSIAIYSLGTSLRVLSDFTSDRERLREAVEHDGTTSVTSRDAAAPRPVHTPAPGDFNATIDRDRRNLAGVVNANRARTTLAALSAIAAHVAGIPGRKNLVWLTANLPFSGGPAVAALTLADVAVYPVDARGLLTETTATDDADVQALLDLKKRFSAQPVVRPTGSDTMEGLAQATGGRAYLNTNDLAGAIRGAIDDASVAYTLGFYADDKMLDGKFHSLKLRLKLGNYEIRYPRGYLALREGEAGDPNRLMEAVETPLEASAIGLVAQVDRVPANALTVSGAIDLRDLGLERKGGQITGAVNLYVVQQDGAGGVLDRYHDRYNLQLTSQMYSDYLKTGVYFRARIAPKAGLATVRVLVSDPQSSRIGSLIIPMPGATAR